MTHIAASPDKEPSKMRTAASTKWSLEELITAIKKGAEELERKPKKSPHDKQLLALLSLHLLASRRDEAEEKAYKALVRFFKSEHISRQQAAKLSDKMAQLEKSRSSRARNRATALGEKVLALLGDEQPQRQLQEAVACWMAHKGPSDGQATGRDSDRIVDDEESVRRRIDGRSAA